MRARLCRALAAGLISLHGMGVAAVIPAWPQAGWVWTEERRADLSGIHLFEREVSAPLAPAQVARTLSVRWPQFNRLMVLDGQILLAGLDASHHWLARIERTPMGARAMVSAMATQAVDGERGEFNAALYATADMRLEFSHARIQDGQRVTQALYASGRSLSVLTRQVAYVLSRAGWSMQGGESGGGTGLWRRASEQLDVSVQGYASGSLWWLQHREVGAP